MREIGQLLGLAANLVAQFYVWRYIFVYYFMEGDKSKYISKKAIVNFGVILFSVMLYSVIGAISTGIPLIILVFLAGVIYFAFVLHRKWEASERLTHPFQKG